MGLLVVAIFGLLVPNGIFLYGVATSPTPWADLLLDPLTVSLLIDAFATMGVLAWLFAVKPPGRVRWPWFVVLSLLGGLVFSVPFFLWLNRRLSADRGAGFASWWRAA